MHAYQRIDPYIKCHLNPSLRLHIKYFALRVCSRSSAYSFIKNIEYSKDKSIFWNPSELISHLDFDSRERSTKSLKSLVNGEKGDAVNNITQAYDIIHKFLSKKSEVDKQQFVNYLMNSVKILRVEVPEDTDLNHYFEIMNSRGEQLEKHEILKSRLLELLKDDKPAYQLFANIWEACANMERYVQYGFNNNIRQQIFGNDWNRLSAQNFDDLTQCLKEKFENITVAIKPKITFFILLNCIMLLFNFIK